LRNAGGLGARLLRARQHRQQLSSLHDLAARGPDPGRDDLHEIDLTGEERRNDDRGHSSRIFVGGTVGHGDKLLGDRLVAKPEIGLSLLADRHHREAATLLRPGPDQAFGCAQHTRVVGARQAPVRDNHERKDVLW